MSSRDIKDSFKVGSRTVVVADCDLRGDITIGSGTVLHPRCTILAVGGPIILGSNNIVEENAVIVNRLKQPMVVGDNNLFEVGCRIESPSVGDWNTFGIRSRVSPFVEVGSNCVVGAGCIVLPSPFPDGDGLADYTHVFGSENRRRTASVEGSGQAKALFVKHWEYLRETLPKHHKLKMF
ncbi:uncharacterized protein RHOBADRAFT_48422 [Rhodotorula graminis WP1]|uniref:Dynactin subunit 6 n=1 Tax=Rhodotorula graminis (strain WP1) TaxID=578459 RepID=A0A194S3R5_RHOGW|nr:uncharacterized protein RHOBADRAFT_48422 [Rhodotorula graminis WP1]KPV75378.1 hypothetical protein RHOBADRAFT_48422 [Rhodotorula graminis WP1]